MANQKLTDLTPASTPLAGTEVVYLVQGGVSKRATTQQMADLPGEWSAETVSQAEAEAGAATTRRAWTALRVAQAIAAWWAGSAAKTKLDGIASGATNTPLSDTTPQAPGTAAAGTATSAARGDHVHPLPAVVSASAAGLVPAFTSATGKVFTDGGWATPTAGTPGGSNGQLQFNNNGAFGGVSTLTTDGSGNLTFSGRWINSRNGAANEPASALTGTWFTGGTATTTKPQFLIEPAGTTSTNWNTSGTGLGINAPSGFTGNLLDLQVGGTSQFRIASNGGAVFPAPSSTFLTFRGVDTNTLGINLTAAGEYYRFWSSQGFFVQAGCAIGWANGLTDTGTYDLRLQRDAADTLAQRRTANPQAFRLYNTFTSATNFERLNVRWTSNEAIIDTEAGSGGGTLRGLKIGSAGTSLLGFYGATPAVQPTAVADATDASTVITQLNALLSRLRTIGIIAT